MDSTDRLVFFLFFLKLSSLRNLYLFYVDDPSDYFSFQHLHTIFSENIRLAKEYLAFMANDTC